MTGKDPLLLSGGNPQIAKGDGDGPVQAYIAALPGWKREVGQRLDAIISQTVADVAKKVRWNTPFYGIGDGTSFVAFHAVSKYIKVTFFRGADLKPMPEVTSKKAGVRYFHVDEPGRFDEEQFAEWIRQASQLPGEKV